MPMISIMKPRKGSSTALVLSTQSLLGTIFKLCEKILLTRILSEVRGRELLVQWAVWV